MDQATKAKEKVKELSEALELKKILITQKDDKIQATLLKTDEGHEKVIAQFLKSERFSDLQFIQYYKGFELLHKWTMKHHNQAVDFSNLDFETIGIEILADEAKEQEEVTTIATAKVAERDDATDARRTNQGHEDEVIIAPQKTFNPPFSLFFFFENIGCPLF